MLGVVMMTFDAMMKDWDYMDSANEHCFKQDDKVSMILNLKTAKLKFMVNDKDAKGLVPIIEKIDNMKYRMFVTLFDANDCIDSQGKYR